MATSLRLFRSAVVNQTLLCNLKRYAWSIPKRNLLSKPYACTDAWNKSLESPSFGDVSLSEFAVQLHDELERSGRISKVDVNIMALQLDQLGDESEAEFLESILKRFNDCAESFPPCKSTAHSIVRGYMLAGLASRLPPILSQRLSYGLFPNRYTINLLLDHFIKANDYSNAVALAHLSTMQEDFSDPVNTLLSLYASSKYLTSLDSVDDLAPPTKEAAEGADEEEEDWIKVKYIRYPYYDDHFDIKDQRFLLGKTLMMVSKSNSVPIPDSIRYNLRLIGAGLYHKFDQGLEVLKQAKQSSDLKISVQALNYFSDSLHKVESRGEDEPEVEIALRTIDDVIHRRLPTHSEKEVLVSEFALLKLIETLPESEFSVFSEVEQFVKSSLGDYETKDIEKQCGLFESWRNEREAQLDQQLLEMRKEERIEEMKKQIKELQEEEELLNYFENEEKIRLIFQEEDAKISDPKLSITKI